jgi:CRISPR-associated endonuclease/helicase Cas3
MKSQFIAHLRKSDQREQSLWTHLTETSEFAGAFAGKIGLEQVGSLLGLLHDVGKASEAFQNYIRSAVGLKNPDEDGYVDSAEMKGKIDHSSAGAQIINTNLADKGTEGKIAAQILSLCIASHHSGLIDCLLPDGQNNFKRRMDKPEDKTHANEVLNTLDRDEQRRLDSCFNKDLATKLILVMNNLREKNESKETLMFKYGLLTRFLFSCLIDADRLNTADFEFPKNKKLRNQNQYPTWDILIQRFNRKKFERKNEVDALRNRISQACLDFSVKPTGLYQLTVPTGGGKTFASLRFGLHHARQHQMDRIVYVIPYTSIIDQNAEEVRRVLEGKDDKGKVVLEHHSNLTPDQETRRQNLLSENWDAPIVFTTSVQFLEALFSAGTRGARRMHQLANAVIVFDEVQTIPVRCVHMFNVALRFLVKGCGSTAVLCTATQPLLDKIERKERALEILPDQQMMPDVKGLFRDLKRVEIHDSRKPGGWTEEEVVELADQELHQSRSVLIVVNTKLSAKKLYQQVKQTVIEDVFHLSTDMCPEHRMNVLNTIKGRLKNNRPTICVSTQLIEAGVDIDFGSVIRYLAGLDSIAQAAGRCNRHGLRANHGNVFIVNPKEENLNRLEEIRIGAQMAERVLDEFKDTPEKFSSDILSPALMEQYYKYYFYDRKDKMNYLVTSKSAVGRDDNLFCLLSTNGLSVDDHKRTHNGSEPAMALRQSFQKASEAFRAIESLTRGVIVQYGKEGKKLVNDLCAAFEVEKQYKLLKRAQRFSVNVYPYVFEDLSKQRAIHEIQEGSGVFYLDSENYSDEFGLSKEIVNEMEPYIVGKE